MASFKSYFWWILNSVCSSSCSDRLIIYSRMRTSYVYVLALSESHSFQANTSDDGGDHNREMPVIQSSENSNF